MSKLNNISCRALFLALLLLGMLVPTALMAQANVQGQWSTLPNLTPINPIHVALLPNGKVLIVAGSGACPPSLQGCPAGAPYGPSNNSGAAIYDPGAGTFTGFTVAWDMFCNGMVLLPDGRAFIVGGTIKYSSNNTGFTGQPQASIFDPATSQMTSAQNMARGRWYPTLTTLGNGQVMTFSGLDETSSTNTDVEIYTVGSGWSAPQNANWTPPLYPWMHLLPNGNVFYSGASASSALYNPSTATWTLNVATTRYGGIRTYGSSVLLPLTPANNYDPKVMILGGNSPATATTEIIDLGAPSPTWQFGPTMSQPRIEMDAVILPNGKILAVGGSANDEDASTASLNADLYDPATNTFSTAGANAFARLYHSVALLLPDATVWLAGGNPAQGTYEQHVEIYKPAYLFQPGGTPAIRPSISSAPSSISWGSSFTVQTPDTANIASVVLVRNGASTHAFNMDQRMVRMSFTPGSGALTVTAPPNSNIAPPGYYMLFILNTSGVPSVARELMVTSSTSPDFSLSATPSTRSVAAGDSASYTATVTAQNGFTGAVSFSASGLPPGASASFSPATVSGSGSTTLTVTTGSSTPPGTYTLTIAGSSGSLSHQSTVGLTVNTPGTSSSLFLASDVPAIVTVNDPNPVELGVKFTASTAGNITALRFYKGPQNTGTHTAHLWSATGTLLASATFAGETASGWQQVNLPTPVAIAANTTYIASYHSNGFYSANGNYFATAHTNGPLTAPDSASSGGNGVYVYGSTVSFPSDTFNATNYWVDVVFAAATSAPPTITSALTASGTVNSPFSYTITATNNPTSFNATGLPAGLSVNTATGVISGTPTTAGTSSVTLSATNAAGTGTATLSLTITQPPTVLLGSQVVQSTVDTNSSGSAEAFQATATASGTVKVLSVYLDSSSTAATLVVGLYTDSGGHPGTLISQATTSLLTRGAWNNIPIPGAAVTSGTKYWLAILGMGNGTLAFRDGSGCTSEGSLQTNLTALPSTWTSGAVYPSCPLSGYGRT